MLLHQRWFTDDGRFPVQWGAALTPQTWIPVAVTLSILALALGLWRLRGREDLVPGPVALGMPWRNYQRLLSWLPLVIGLHAAVPLLVSGVHAQLFVPNLPLPRNLVGGLLGLAQIVIALGFFYGALTRLAAVTLVLVWLSGAILFGPVELLEQSLFLGIAAFLFAAGRGPLAFDRVLERLHRPFASWVPAAVRALRVLTGLSIVTLAFTEKLWNLPMGLDFLERHPFNFFPALGLDRVDDRAFLLIAGTLELTFGALLISGAFRRLVILLLWLPFNLTLPFLGVVELVGHLPIYGIMTLLLVWEEKGGEPALGGAR
jgi:uncharacterized membrane protein YphA (DoxX/SURF4 family)